MRYISFYLLLLLLLKELLRFLEGWPRSIFFERKLCGQFIRTIKVVVIDACMPNERNFVKIGARVFVFASLIYNQCLAESEQTQPVWKTHALSEKAS